MNIRKIVLDTETTGINRFDLHYINHKIIEIGAIEIINRKITKNIFHTYLNPNRKIDEDAYKIHKINNEFLKDKPFFNEISDKFINFIYNSTLIIHNAKFDVDFINYELKLMNHKIKDISKICIIIDSLYLARNKFIGKRNSLEALCERYKIKNNNLHSALSDAESLAKIFLLLTSNQKDIKFKFNKKYDLINKLNLNNKKLELKIIYANNNELNNHKKILQYMKKKINLTN